jgi:hypothetical protein
MALGKEYQAKVNSAENVLVGVAQVRVGKPSTRNSEEAVIKSVQSVTQSTLKAVTLRSGLSINVVKPTRIANESTSDDFVSSGTYTGDYDGAFIVRFDGTDYSVFGPDGVETTGVTIVEITAGYDMLVATAATGATITGTAVAPAVGDTWVIPVWSAGEKTNEQTRIITPYSMFSTDNESVGGLVDSSFTPSLDEVKTLESGFPSTTDATIITKTSVEVTFGALEYTNANLVYLRDMISGIINDAASSALSVEVVAQTRGGDLITFWCPNAELSNLPSIAPTNDFSTMTWSLKASTQSAEVELSEVYNKWLTEAPIFSELTYLH